MDIKTVALNMWPCWLLGVLMIWTTLRSEHKDLVRVDKRAFPPFIKAMLFLFAYRFFFFKFLAGKTMMDAIVGAKQLNGVLSIPWPLTLTVFWEDACHTLPLALLQRFVGESMPAKIFYYAMLIMVMFSFALGHVYQGYFAAAMISMAIPWTLSLGKKYGFGTMMICHMLYDLTTILTLKWLLG